MTTKFQTLDDKILATLEEAGEEGIAALLNIVNSDASHGSEDEIEAFRLTLTRLVNSGLLAVARVRDSESKRWIVLSNSEAISIFHGLKSVLRWSKADKLWVWNSTSPRIHVLLTASAEAAAKKILLEHGWQ